LFRGLGRKPVPPLHRTGEVVAAVSRKPVALQPDRAAESQPFQGPQYAAHVIRAAVERLDEAVPLRPLDPGIGAVDGHREQGGTRLLEQGGNLVLIARGKEDRHPGPDDIALVVEVADSSLADDRQMATEVYGPAGVPVYWIVNLVHRQVEVYTDPGPEGYRSCAVFAEVQSVPVVIDGQPLGRVAVADLLPSRPATPEAKGNGA